MNFITQMNTDKPTRARRNILKDTHHMKTNGLCDAVLTAFHLTYRKSFKNDVKSLTIFFWCIKGKNTHLLITFP